MKKYIAYRYFNNIFYWTYERVELTEKELTEYIKKHLRRIKEYRSIYKRKQSKDRYKSRYRGEQMNIYGIYDEEEKEQCIRVRTSGRDNKIHRNNSKEI